MKIKSVVVDGRKYMVLYIDDSVSIFKRKLFVADCYDCIPQSVKTFIKRNSPHNMSDGVTVYF